MFVAYFIDIFNLLYISLVLFRKYLNYQNIQDDESKIVVGI